MYFPVGYKNESHIIITMRDLKKILSLSADYIDIRRIRSEVQSLTAKDKVVESLDSGVYSGIGIRVLLEGRWGFSVVNSEEKALDAANKALKMARAAGSKGDAEKKEGLAPVEVIQKEVGGSVDFPSLEESVKLILSCEKEAELKSVKSTTTSLANSLLEKQFFSSEGSSVIQRHFRSFLSTHAVAKRGGVLQEAYERSTSLEGLRHNPEIGREAGERAVRLLDGKSCPSGEMHVVMDPELVAVFLHEAFGHMAEADAVLEGCSILNGRIGEKIASALITIIDDGTASGYGRLWYDDEGVAAKKNVLLENGILKGFMHNRETAGQLGSKPTGNARAQGYDSRPIIRMTNTYCLEGKSSFDELVGDVKNGVYLKGSRGGQTNPARGVFQFACQEGYLVKGGEIKGSIRNAGISGNTLEVLNNISLVGDDFKLGSPGHCGKKGQGMPVDGGGPHILTKTTVGGA
ncbi:TldD/PmbA family protein [Candidatus Altiarchaeota archaeon]